MGHQVDDCCHPKSKKPDYLLWVSFLSVALFYLQAMVLSPDLEMPLWYATLIDSVYELINVMWLGLFLGIVMISILSKIPREFVLFILGSHSGLQGIFRATAAGVLLDLCSHGILMVGAKLYERGANIGQVMAFLIASPWNSFSLTLILIALIGFSCTVIFILLSLIVAIIVGCLYDKLEHAGKIPGNPNRATLPRDFKFWQAAKVGFTQTHFNSVFFITMIKDGLIASKVVVKWLLFGVMLAALIRAFVSPGAFTAYFGPTLAGLGLTVILGTVIEVCSEGSTPIAADLLTRAHSPGNSFAFLMTGVSTDYTEIMVMKETTSSWKIPLLLPLLTLPQVILIAWLLNLTTSS